MEDEDEDQFILGKKNLATDLFCETAKELEIISSVIATLYTSMNIYENIKIEQNFLYNLNQLFITQFNTQTVSEYTTNSIIHCINKYMNDKNKNPKEILNQYYNYQCRYYYTSIIGFFHEYGIGTIVDYSRALNMYRKASKDFNYSPIDSFLLKENQFIGLVSLGLLYLNGKGVRNNQSKALQLFLKAVVKGSCLGKFYIGECYNYGYGVIQDTRHSFNWYLNSAKEGNISAKNIVGCCYETGKGISRNYNEAIKWYQQSANSGNYLAYNNLGNLYKYGLGISDLGLVLLTKE
ncbi:26639_t:CDS:2 [Gigaspora margarita]|uniref:26639_t:CDS:1 n=1 Tax=Gigaspora margarita TaxID=4874 RepID=A0ABN7UJ06_GIGMA|nr:26639_t:CDS:2 [Gigaspora margarita]